MTSAVETPCCELRLYSNLNDFVRPDLRHRTLLRPVGGRPTAKDLIEGAGVPHPEVDLIVVNDVPVDFQHRVEPRDRVAVYPRFEQLNVSPEVRLLPPPRDEERFVLDGHLGRLARLLRLLGFDASYRSDADDSELVALSINEDRTLLTRDVGLLKRKQLKRGYWVRATAPRRQVVEVARRFSSTPNVQPLSRCLACNDVLAPIAAAAVADLVPARSRSAFNEYSRCSGCQRVYWPGSHFDRLTTVVEETLAELTIPSIER